MFRKHDKRFYIAYGSNINRTIMRRRCPDARAIGRITLSDARLVFRVHADLIYEPGSFVPAVLWEISELDERSLDHAEGVHKDSYGKWYIDYQGRKCAIYLMIDGGVYPPAAYYADLIREGYKTFNLDQSFLNAAIKNSFEDKSPTENTNARRRNQRRVKLTRDLVPLPESVAMARLERQRELAAAMAPYSYEVPYAEPKKNGETLWQYLKRAKIEGIPT